MSPVAESERWNNADENTKIAPRLLEKLKCVSCDHEELDYTGNTLTCKSCGATYPVHKGVPSMMIDAGTADQDWNPWDREDVQAMGDSYYKRATGELIEKESSRSYAKLLKRTGIYQPGDEILDIGCATGHFLRSFREHMDKDTLYTGLDATPHLLSWGAEIFGVNNQSTFTHSDVLNMPYKDNSFDIVVVNLFHFFPDIKKALAAVMRVARKQVVWRTPVGPVNYMMRIYIDNDYNDIGLITPEPTDVSHINYMLYTKKYIEDLVADMGGKVTHFERDTDFNDFDNTKEKGFEHVTATKVVSGMQINGSIVLDWSYFCMEPPK